MVHTLLNNESPEVIRYFRHLEYLTTLWEKDREKYRPVLNGERYLTEAELSGLLKVTQRTLIEHRSNGKLPFYKFGGRILYKENDIIRILEQNGWKPSIPISRIAFLPASHKKRAFFNSHQMNR